MDRETEKRFWQYAVDDNHHIKGRAFSSERAHSVERVINDIATVRAYDISDQKPDFLNEYQRRLKACKTFNDTFQVLLELQYDLYYQSDR